MYDYLDSDGVQAVLEAVKGKIPTVSNPNLLINPNFAINQRGNTGITISSSTWANFFIADRWKLFINNASPSGTIQRNDDGTITLSMTAGYCDIVQVFERYMEEDYYSLSAKINGEIVTLSGYLYSGKELIDNSKGLVLSESGFKIRCHAGNTITVEWAKLEKGKNHTNYVPPNMAEEMPKCLRYFEKIEYPTSSGLPAVQWQNDLKNCVANISFFTKRISSPTITVTGISGWRFVSSTGIINITGSKIWTTSANSIGLSFTLQSATSVPSFGWVDRFNVIIEAEL